MKPIFCDWTEPRTDSQGDPYTCHWGVVVWLGETLNNGQVYVRFIDLDDRISFNRHPANPDELVVTDDEGNPLEGNYTLANVMDTLPKLAPGEYANLDRLREVY